MKLKISKIIGFYPNDKKTGQPNQDQYGTFTYVWMFVEGQDGVFTGKARAGSPMLFFKAGDEVDLVITSEKQVGDKKYVNFRLGGEVKAPINAPKTPQDESLGQKQTITPPAQNGAINANLERQIFARLEGLEKRMTGVEKELNDLKNEGNVSF